MLIRVKGSLVVVSAVLLASVLWATSTNGDGSASKADEPSGAGLLGEVAKLKAVVNELSGREAVIKKQVADLKATNKQLRDELKRIPNTFLRTRLRVDSEAAGGLPAAFPRDRHAERNTERLVKIHFDPPFEEAPIASAALTLVHVKKGATFCEVFISECTREYVVVGFIRGAACEVQTMDATVLVVGRRAAASTRWPWTAQDTIASGKPSESTMNPGEEIREQPR